MTDVTIDGRGFSVRNRRVHVVGARMEYALVDRGQWPDWIRHWISLGFKALEVQLAKRTDPFSFGKRPGVLECYLVPQVYNANRYELDMSLFPRIQNIYDRCMQLEPFQLAAPDAQPDAE